MKPMGDTVCAVCRAILVLAAVGTARMPESDAGVSVAPAEPFADSDGSLRPRSIPSSRLDLVVSKVEIIRDLKLFGETRLKVRPHVKNIGSEDYAGPVKLQIAFYRRYTCTIEGGIRSGQESTTDGACASFRESHHPVLPPVAIRFQVNVDPENRIPEKDESNNFCRVPITFSFDEYIVHDCGYAKKRETIPVM